MYDVFEFAIARNGGRPAMGERAIERSEMVEGFEKLTLSEYKWSTFTQVKQRVGNVASGLADLASLKKGDRVVIYADTKMEWQLAAQAVFARGCSVVTIYATLGPDSFGEWRAALADAKLAEGVVAMPALPGVFHEQKEIVTYEHGTDFLTAMRAIGAGEPRPGYRPLPPGKLRRSLRALERDHKARITWHIVYGRIGALR